MRNRTHSWSNVDKRSVSAKPISAHPRQHSAIVTDSRYRTTSEGNAHFDIKPRSIGKLIKNLIFYVVKYFSVILRFYETIHLIIMSYIVVTFIVEIMK